MFLTLLCLVPSFSLQFLVFSDLHYPSSAICNKFLVSANCDTSDLLLNSTLTAMQNNFIDVDLIVSLGDEISHGQRSSFQLKSTINTLFEAYNDFFPKATKIHTIGNNEGFSLKQTQREYLDHLAYLYQFWVPSHWRSYKFLSNGFYSLVVEEIKFVVLNSNHFVVDSDVSDEQLEWLFMELAGIGNLSAVILTHSPPVNSMFNSGERVWTDRNLVKFRGIVQEFHKKIVAILSGHLHRGTFSSISGVPVIINPSVSPVYQTNPSFRAYMIEDNSVDFEEFVLIDENWVLSYKFSDLFGKVENIPYLVDLAETDDVLLDKMMKVSRGFLVDSELNMMNLYTIATNSTLDLEKMRRIVWCSLNDYSYEKFMACRGI